MVEGGREGERERPAQGVQQLHDEASSALSPQALALLGYLRPNNNFVR